MIPLMVLVLFSMTTIYLLISISRRQFNQNLPKKASDGEKKLQHNSIPTTTQHILGPMSPHLPDYITAWDNDKIDRVQWVGRITDHVGNSRHRGRYNVLTINHDLEYHLNVNDVVEEFLVTYQDKPKRRKIPYRVIVFESAELINLGDGGFINLQMEGNFANLGVSIISFQPRMISRV